MEGESYTQSFIVTSADCDIRRRMMPSALLRLCQNIATSHCSALGLTSEFLAEHHLAFLLAKLACQWDRPILLEEQITLRTQPETMKRAVFKRITEVTDVAGRQVALADSRWVLVDTETRRILRRPTDEVAALPFAEHVEQELPFTLPRPDSTEHLYESRAGYSLCDQNGHLNNTRYIDISCDALPLESLAETPARYLCVNYHSEIPAGQNFAVERIQLGERDWYVACTKPQKRCFEGFFTLSEPGWAER